MQSAQTHIKDKLIAAGLRPTRQRLLIGGWLFSGVDKHFTAEELHRDMMKSDGTVSLATIYNTLGTFTEAGLLHTVNVDSGRMFYDTNTGPHYHLYDEDGQILRDVAIDQFGITGLPDLPAGQVIDRIDVIIRTKSG